MNLNMRGDAIMISPLFVDTKNARQIIGCGHTKLYELITLGRLDARKLGNKTLITTESIKRYADELPKAQINSQIRQPIGDGRGNNATALPKPHSKIAEATSARTAG
jgi:hypothetical protein